MSPTEKAYGVRVLEAIKLQCDRRGIPPEEVESVLAHIADEYGETVLQMGAGPLKRVQANLDALMTDYLEGAKRRGGPPGAWDVNATEAAILHATVSGVDLDEVEGTGEGGRVTKGDVDAYLAD